MVALASGSLEPAAASTTPVRRGHRRGPPRRGAVPARAAAAGAARACRRKRPGAGGSRWRPGSAGGGYPPWLWYAAVSSRGSTRTRPAGLDRAHDLRQRGRGVAEVGGAQIRCAQPAASPARPPSPSALRRWPRRADPGCRARPPPGRAQACMPHSVLPVPAHRPLRGSAPGSTRIVQVEQPIEG
jgi:hypothetical protein